MEILKLRDDGIKLGQALKAAGLVSSGVEAKVLVQGGKVKVNDLLCVQRGKQLKDGDVIEYRGIRVKIEANK